MYEYGFLVHTILYIYFRSKEFTMVYFRYIPDHRFTMVTSQPINPAPGILKSVQIYKQLFCLNQIALVIINIIYVRDIPCYYSMYILQVSTPATIQYKKYLVTYCEFPAF